MRRINRREFVRVGAAAGVAGGLWWLEGESVSAVVTGKSASDRVVLGDTGIEVTRLAMGTGTNGGGKESNQTRKLGVQGLADLLEEAFERGVRFWDAADQYGTHPHLREALKRVSREDVVILTKTHASTEAEMKADLDRFRQELGTDYLDIVLLHCMMTADWPKRKQGAMEVLAGAREDGIVRAHGVSCHTLEALRVASETDWVQVDLARINPAGSSMDADVETVVRLLRKMKAAGKGVIGMKILGAGELVDRIDESLRFVLNLDCVDCFTIGTESREEFCDLYARIERAGTAA
ncbi:MAG TPA: aldo/keto reductase [Acidobacteriota bacterium]|nr:aldo/keto reductase [Acidobacteriota bacterium]HRV06899.1 aldo/keto reductase [Acidobacteriota bacterium]